MNNNLHKKLMEKFVKIGQEKERERILKKIEKCKIHTMGALILIEKEELKKELEE